MLADWQLLVGGLLRSRRLAAQAIDVVMAAASRTAQHWPSWITSSTANPGVVDGSGERADQVGGEAPQVVEHDRFLLVHFCIEQQPALLREHAPSTDRGAVREAGEVAVHEWSP